MKVGCKTMTADTEACQIVAEKNASRTVSLTVDALIRVFLLLSHSEADTTDWEWVTVAEVCRFWHTVAIETPALWSFFCRFESTKRTEKYLKLSKNADLTIYFSVQKHGFQVTGKTKNYISHNLKMVLEEIHRIKHLYILNDHLLSIKKINALFQKAAPRIHTIHYEEMHHSIELKAIIASSSLRCLTLDGIGSSDYIYSLHGLQHLSVSIDVDLKDLLPFLRGCPGLVSLSVVNCDYEDFPSKKKKKIDLPNLRKLRVQDDDYDTCYRFMRTIHAPKVVCLDIVSDIISSSSEIRNIRVLSSFLAEEYPCERIYVILSETGLEVMINRRWRIDGSDEDERGGAFIEFSRIPDKKLHRVSESTFSVLQTYLEKSESLQIGGKSDSLSGTSKTWSSLINKTISIKNLTILLVHGFDEIKCIDSLLPLDGTPIPCPTLECVVIQLPNRRTIPCSFTETLETLLVTRADYGVAVHKLVFRSSKAHQCETRRLERLRRLVKVFELECRVTE